MWGQTSSEHGPDSDDLGRKMMRQVAGAFMEYEKGALGRQAARRPGKQAQGDREESWRKSHCSAVAGGVAEARCLRSAKGKAGRLSYREISARLKDAGYCNEGGEPFNPQSV